MQNSKQDSGIKYPKRKYTRTTIYIYIWIGHQSHINQLCFRSVKPKAITDRNESHITVYPKKYAHGFCFAVLCGYTLTDFPICIRLTSLALWQSNDCPSASKATLMNMDKYFMWIHYERLHNHNKAKHNKTVCIFFLGYTVYICLPHIELIRGLCCLTYVATSAMFLPHLIVCTTRSYGCSLFRYMASDGQYPEKARGIKYLVQCFYSEISFLYYVLCTVIFHRRSLKYFCIKHRLMHYHIQLQLNTYVVEDVINGRHN